MDQTSYKNKLQHTTYMEHTSYKNKLQHTTQMESHLKTRTTHLWCNFIEPDENHNQSKFTLLAMKTIIEWNFLWLCVVK